MQCEMQSLRKYREEIEAARAEALRLGNATLHTILTMGLLAVEDKLKKLGDSHARTAPQVEALKRLIGPN